MAKIPMADKEFKKDDEDFKEEVMGHKRDLALDYKSEFHEYKDKTSQGKIIISQVDFKKKLLKHQIVDSAEIDIEEGEWEDYGHGAGQINCKLSLFIGISLYLRIDGRVNKKEIEEEIKEDFREIELSKDRYITNVIIRSLDEEVSKRVSQANTIVLDDDLKTIWQDTSYFRLFISHRAKYKKEVSELKQHLWNYGISCFIAHEDIEPSEPWIEEIKKALYSMDALLAYITDDFSGGNYWTDQEIGFAVSRRSHIIPVKLSGNDPHGFMASIQGLSSSQQDIPKLADNIYKGILKKFEGTHEGIRKFEERRKFEELQKTKESQQQEEVLKIARMKKGFISSFINSKDFSAAKNAFGELRNIEQFTDEELDTLVGAFNDNDQINNCFEIQNYFFTFLQARSNHAFEKVNDYEIRRIE